MSDFPLTTDISAPKNGEKHARWGNTVGDDGAHGRCGLLLAGPTLALTDSLTHSRSA